MRIRALSYGPLLFVAVRRFSLEIDKPVHLWSWAAHLCFFFSFIITIFIIIYV